MTITSTRTTRSSVIPETKSNTAKFRSVAEGRRSKMPLSGWPGEVLDDTTTSTTAGTSLARTTFHDEPRILDTDLAERLGMKRLRDIRDLIRAHLSELEQFGSLPSVTAKTTRDARGRGRPSVSYYLNEEQALLVCIFSQTERAAIVRKEAITAFMAHRRGRLRPTAPVTAAPLSFADALRLAAEQLECAVP